MGRYPDQPISVINSGKPGEDTRDGKQRLPGVLDQVRPDVVMILEEDQWALVRRSGPNGRRHRLDGQVSPEPRG